MKITRIKRIKAYRNFRDFDWPIGLPNFGSFNLIYGWNGSGKTTLSTLLYCLQKKESIALTEGEVQFQIDDSLIVGSAISTATLPAVRVFNRNSVDRNVFEVPNQQLPPVYFLGEDCVEKEKRIVMLKKRLDRAEKIKVAWKLRKTNTEADYEKFCTDRGREIKNLLTVSGGGPYNNFDARFFKQTIQRLLTMKSPYQRLSDKQRTRNLATKEGIPKSRIDLLSLEYPDFAAITKQVQDILKRSILSSGLPDLIANPAVAAWVAQGLGLHAEQHTSSKCKFCNQPIPTERLEQLRAHFNDHFNQFQAEITELIDAVETSKSSILSLQLPDKELLYSHLVEEYEKTINALSQQSSIAKMYLNALHTALLAKKEEPFRQFELLPFMTASYEIDGKQSTLAAVLQMIAGAAVTIITMFGQGAYDKIVAIIKNHNNHSDNFAQKVNDARKALEEDAVAEALQDYQKKIKAISDAEAKLLKADALDSIIRTNIKTLELVIRQHQRAAEELTHEMASYLGRNELRFESHESGYTITRNGQPAMNLSEGERTAIAFMYFLKSLEDTSFDANSGVVVIDDPVSSLDANSLYSAFGFLKARTRNANQLFVLTHNFTFFRLVKNWFQKRPKKDKITRPAEFYMLRYKIINGECGAVIESLDKLLHDFESEYHYLFKCVYEEANQSAAASLHSYYGLPNIARKLLEAFLAFRMPGHLPDSLYHKLELVQFDEAKKARILRFLNTYSHFDQIGDPDHDISVLSETPSILQDILRLIKTTDRSHYDGMLSLLQP
jgi:wobble nucleotide-excising tRNase